MSLDDSTAVSRAELSVRIPVCPINAATALVLGSRAVLRQLQSDGEAADG